MGAILTKVSGCVTAEEIIVYLAEVFSHPKRGRPYRELFDLREADLSDAKLIGADLSGVDLSGAKLRTPHVTVDQLVEAKTLYRTKLLPTIETELREKYPERYKGLIKQTE